jgi:hypothetical protein
MVKVEVGGVLIHVAEAELTGISTDASTVHLMLPKLSYYERT